MDCLQILTSGIKDKYAEARKIYEILRDQNPSFYLEDRFLSDEFNPDELVPLEFDDEYRDGPRKKVLTREEEQFLFMHANWAKSKAWGECCRLFNGNGYHDIEQTEYGTERLDNILGYWNKASYDENWIATANVPLVLRFASLHGSGKVYFDDIVNEAYEIVCHAIRKFDYRLGYKFSTYLACAIWRTKAKYMNKVTLRHEITINPIARKQVDNHESINYFYSINGEEICDCLRGIILQDSVLSDEQREVLTLRFPQDSAATALTVRETGKKLHLSKTRINQIEMAGLRRLREELEKVF